MADLLEQKTVKTRKTHICWGCGRSFPKGTELEYCKCVDSGSFSTAYWCKTCLELWKYADELCINSYDGIDKGDFYFMAKDELLDNVEDLLEYCKKERAEKQKRGRNV